MKRTTVLPILALALALQACGFKPSDLNFDDSNVARGSPSTSEDYSILNVMADRAYVESVLGQVFGIQSPSVYQSNTTAGALTVPTAMKALEDDIYFRREFGGACDRYAGGEVPVSTTAIIEYRREECKGGIGVYQPALSSPQRYAFTIKSCEKLVMDNTHFANAMTRIFPSWASTQPNPDAQSITKVYQAFLPTESPSQELIDHLVDMSADAGGKTEAWRRILLTFCISPEWQVF